MKGEKNSERTFRKLPDDGIRGRGATELGEATVANSLNDVRHLRGRGTKKRVLNNVFIFSDPLPFIFLWGRNFGVELAFSQSRERR